MERCDNDRVGGDERGDQGGDGHGGGGGVRARELQLVISVFLEIESLFLGFEVELSETRKSVGEGVGFAGGEFPVEVETGECLPGVNVASTLFRRLGPVGSEWHVVGDDGEFVTDEVFSELENAHQRCEEFLISGGPVLLIGTELS